MGSDDRRLRACVSVADARRWQESILLTLAPAMQAPPEDPSLPAVLGGRSFPTPVFR